MEIDPSKIQVYINCGGKSGSKTLEKTLSQYYRCLHTHGNFYFQQFILFGRGGIWQTLTYAHKFKYKVFYVDATVLGQ